MNEAHIILDRLLDKYENSLHFRDHSQSKRRILLKLGTHYKDLPEYDIENTDTKRRFNDAIKELNQTRLIGFEWVPFEIGNIIAKVWLDLSHIEDAYSYIQRIPKKQRALQAASHIQEWISEAAGITETSQWITDALSHETQKIQETYNLPNYLAGDETSITDFLACLRGLSQIQKTPASLRVFSQSVLHDSKAIEKTYLARLKSFVRKNHPTFCSLTTEDEPTEEELLAGINLYRNPEIYEFTGPLQITFSHPDKPSMQLDFSIFTRGATLHASSVSQIIDMQTAPITSVLFIENRTNYEEYIINTRRPDELVIYHGGFHSPSKGDFFRKLIAAVRPDTPIYHWGDIDLGGIKIFMQIKSEICPRILPKNMDRETLLTMLPYAIPFSQQYEKKLQTSLQDPSLESFHDLINAMLEYKVRLEQEAFLR